MASRVEPGANSVPVTQAGNVVSSGTVIRGEFPHQRDELHSAQGGTRQTGFFGSGCMTRLFNFLGRCLGWLWSCLCCRRGAARREAAPVQVAHGVNLNPGRAHVLQREPEVNAQNRNRITALHIACEKANIDQVKALLNTGANVIAQDKQGKTPLHHLCSSRGGLKTADRKLLGIPFDSPDHPSLGILLLLHEKGEMNIHIRDNQGRTPLHYAAEAGKAHLVTALLQKCHAEVNALDRKGATPLNLAIAKGRKEVIAILEGCGAKNEGPARAPAKKRRELAFPAQLKTPTPPSEEASDTEQEASGTDYIKTAPLPEGALDQIGD
ncbi:MAG: ankyrin repeat domain-containing protein [Chlamydiales bacterium]